MVDGLLDRLGVPATAYTHGNHPVHTPIDGSAIAAVHLESKAQVTAKIDQAEKAFQAWRNVPAPRRGELIRLFGEVLRKHKAELGELVSIEAGKITQEGLGEVQEMID
ncbi:MAG: aldehyde dehydrogenase family protein, partial [Pseudomonas sp.]|uniref:aldehyde dehydrogenase family protein n=3 Tax=unclassified Pseudomonas TaxID=196821 RepID=UPI003D145DD6